MKNIHVLPTDKPSKLFYNVGGTLLYTSYGNHNGVNIYITNDEEDINENDYIITKDGRLVQVSYLLSKDVYSASKVILATDQELIKDGVQSIDDNFLEWFIKNPKSENVYVYKEYKQVNQNNPVTRGSTALAFSHYEVQSLDLSAPIGTNEKEIMTNLPNGDDFFKQETLEEAATNYLHRVADGKRFTGYADEDFINGAKWQADKVFSDDVIQTLEKALAILLKRQERMYNENEVELIANEMVNWAIDNVGNPNPQSGRKFDEVIAKFKKK